MTGERKGHGVSSSILRCSLQTGSLTLVLLLAHHPIELLLGLFLPLDLLPLLLLPLLQEVLVLEALRPAGLLPLVAVDGAQRVQQSGHLGGHRTGEDMFH